MSSFVEVDKVIDDFERFNRFRMKSSQENVNQLQECNLKNQITLILGHTNFILFDMFLNVHSRI